MTVRPTAQMSLVTTSRPSLALRRVHLRSVGPDVARFDPLDLDHSVAGKTAARVLWSLTNTGGKTTLIRLLTSVIVPRATEAMGHANIGEYVQTGDTSHVLLEWEATGIGRFVVAAVYEWPNRTRPATTPIRELKRSWYTFRCGEVGIDDLPFEVDHRRRVFDDFRTQLTELFRDRASARYVWAPTQTEWATALDTHTPLDAELFRYQMRMNDEESGADALVRKLTSPDSVVRFFVESLNDDDALRDFTRTMGAYAEAARQRDTWLADHGFCVAVGERLVELSGAEDRFREAIRRQDEARYAAGELAGRIAARAASGERRMAELEQGHQAATARTEELSRSVNRYENIRAQLLLEQAIFTAAAAQAEYDEADRARAVARRAAAAWRVVTPYRTWLAARSAEATARDAYTRADRDIAPLRASRRAVGASLAARYSSLATEAIAAAREADETAKASERRRSEAEKAISSDSRREWAAQRAIEAIDKSLLRGRQAIAGLIAAGHAEAGEEPVDAEARWARSVTAALGSEKAARARTQAAAAEFARLRPLHPAAVEEARIAAVLYSGAAGRLQSFRDDLAALDSDPAVRDVAGGAVEDSETVERVRDLAERRAGDAERDADLAERRVEALDREIAALERGDLLTTVTDIEAVVVAVRKEGVGAVTGWQWLARHVQDVEERRRLIAARPDLANGVVVTDRTRLEDARRAVDGAGLSGRVAVLVTSATGPVPVGPDRFVVEPHRALYDPEWAARTLAELRTEREVVAGRAESAREAANAARRVVAEAGAFVRRWPAGTHARLREQEAVTQTAERAARSEVARLENEIVQAEQRRSAADRQVAEAVEVGRAAESHRQAAAAAAALVRAGAEAEDRRPAEVQALATAERDRVSAEAAKAEAERDRDAAVQRASDNRALAEWYRTAQQGVGVEPDGEAPHRPLAELESEWQMRCRLLREAEAGSDHGARLTAAEEATANAKAQLDAFPDDVVGTAAELTGTLAAASRQSIASSLRAAEAAADAADTTWATADQASRAAHDIVAARRPSDDRSVHRDLTAEPEWVPTDAADATAKIAVIDERNAGLRSELRDQQNLVRRLHEEVGEVRSALSTLTAAASLWPEPETAPELYLGSAEDALNDMRRSVDGHRRAAEATRFRESQRRDAADHVRKVAGDWSVSSPIREQCRTAPVEQLAADATGYARVVEIRARSLADDLANLDRHRDTLVTQILGLCQVQRRLLREVTALSKLPAGFGDLSGQAAFKIEFDTASDSEARGRLATRIDDWARALAADPKAATTPTKRVAWLTEALRDTLRSGPRSGPWRVQVLKPPTDFSLAYRTPDRIPIEYSGGQELTLAVLLYCALAAVRAQNRTSGERPPGALIIDNPFGRASNPTLIRIQQALAAEAGLQLVCATGIDDPNVLASFEGDAGRVVRLRNDRDQRRGLQYLRVADPDAAAVLEVGIRGGRPVEDPSGWVTGTGYTVRDRDDGAG